jgi:hypothetical protein
MKKAVFALMAALAFILPGPAISGDITLIQSEGIAAKSDDITEVKRKAMEQALKAAVLESAKTILAKESLSAPANALETIASTPRAFVLNYKIRSEGWITHMDSASQTASAEGSTAGGTELYHIWIDASIDATALRAAVAKRVSTGAITGQVVINLMDVRDYPTFALLVESLQKIAFIKEVSYGSFTNGRITLTATVSGDASQLAGRIAREVPEKFAIMEGAGQIIIKPSALSAQ